MAATTQHADFSIGVPSDTCMQSYIRSRYSKLERQQRYWQKQRTCAAGEGSDCGKNARATSDGAESGVSGVKKLKHVGSTAGGRGEYARHTHGGSGRGHMIATGPIKGSRNGGIIG